MKILIADDASQKIGVIRRVLKELPGYDTFTVEQVLDLNSAKAKLAADYYDLLILDLNMPLAIEDPPDMKAGAEFVDELMNTHRIKMPIDIFVLSAFDDSVQEFKKQVERAGFVVAQYDETSTAWRDTLKSRVAYLQLLREQRSYVPNPPPCDVLFITAVPVETKAIMALHTAWESFQFPDDSTVYRHAEFQTNNTTYHVIHTELSEMGMTAAATHTAKAVLRFHPKQVIMTGIAGGLEKDANIGDIIVATDVWNYNSGKYIDPNSANTNTPELLPDSKHLLLDRGTLDKLKATSFDQQLVQIKNSFSGNAPGFPLQIFFGPMACGSAVVTSRDVIEMIKSQSRKAAGLDMESYGVYFACREVCNPGVNAIVIKSISDFADRKKDDAGQDYAAYTSAQLAMHLMHIGLF